METVCSNLSLLLFVLIHKRWHSFHFGFNSSFRLNTKTKRICWVMANESEMNLGLALGSTTTTTTNQQQMESSGAGANANLRSRIDKKTFLRPRPLTELVWSTQNGLSIKCAGCSTCFADNNPCCLFRDFSPSQHEKCALKSITPGPFLGSSLDENVGEVKRVHFIEMESKGKEKNIPVGNVVGTSEVGPHNQRTADLLPLLASEPENLESKIENIGDGTDRLGLNIGLPLKIQDECQEPPVPAHVKRDEDNSKEDGSSSAAPSPEKMEETAENDVHDLIAKDAAILENVERDRRGDLVPGEASSGDSRMRVVQNREESCKEGNERDDDNSHGSMESCNSANLSSKGNKRWRFEQQLIIGSKRIKKQSQECPFSTPVVKQDSSFMNWISNMVKGIKPCQDEGHPPALSAGHPIDDDQKMDACDKTLNFVRKNLGFQTVFQSLYSQDAKRIETRTQVENKSVGESKEIILFDKTVSNHGPVDILNQKAIGNLWIARFSPKTPPSTLLTSNNSDLKRDSSTRTSIDVVKHTRPMATQSKTSCLFCGKRGHDLRNCLEINEKEVEGFLKNIRLYEGVSKEAPCCLCIKCFQLNHWASACPSNKTKGESWSDLKLKLKKNGNVLLSEIPKHPVSSSGKIPKEMLESIRMLRLSRTDILKWMNSGLAMTRLEGYFVRLRLAKWEEGVGYYVGCITASVPSKGSICVNIGGVECLVETRYISNCDFLEDEVIGWWETMLTSRGRPPIQEELASKLKDRKMLGF